MKGVGESMETLHYTYDPLTLVRLVLNRYAEELEGKHTKAIQFARYEYLRTLTDNELEGFLHRYMEEEKLESITLEDWKKDSEYLLGYVYETERYQALELKFQRAGYGETGLGVVDRKDNTFYDCDYAHHWETIIKILQEKYPKLYQAFEILNLRAGLMEYNGITRMYLDRYIMDNFELVGGSKPIDDYTGF